MVRRIALVTGLVVAGLASGAALLVGVELCLRALDVRVARPDPLSGFSSLVPVFDADRRPDGRRVFHLSPARRIAAAPNSIDDPIESFAADRTPGTFRVFTIGGSSTAGVPYRPSLAFAGWIARGLQAALPEIPIEVVNAGVPGYGTQRELDEVREIARHHPDLLVVYTGHNEFVEAAQFERLQHLVPLPLPLWEQLASTRLFGLVSAAVPAAAPSLRQRVLWLADGSRVRAEMFAALATATQGDAAAVQIDVAATGVRYRDRLTAMVETMRAVGAHVMLCSIGQNFADWEPGGSSHREDLAPPERRAWEAAVADGDALAPTDCPAALDRYARALAIDDAHAGLLWRIALCERRVGRLDAARSHFRQASDADRFHYGAPTSFNDAVRDVASGTGSMFVDVDGVLSAASPGGLVGDNLFVDFVHPNLRAHQLIAGAILEALRAAGIPRPAAAWRDLTAPPDPAVLYAAEPRLRVREHLVRALSCELARRVPCAIAEAEAAAALDPDDPDARALVAALHGASPPPPGTTAGATGSS